MKNNNQTQTQSTFTQFLRRPIKITHVNKRLDAFVQAISKMIAVDKSSVVLSTVSYQRQYVNDTVDGLAFIIEHKDKELNLHASVYVLWVANNPGCPVVSNDQFLGMDSEMHRPVNMMLSDVHAVLQGKHDKSDKDHTHIEMHYVGSTTIPTSVEFDDERVVNLARFALSHITNYIETLDEDMGIRALSLMEGENFKVTTSFHEKDITDVLGFPIRNDVTLRLVHTPRPGGPGPGNSQEFLLLTVSGYIELVRAEETNNNNNNPRGFAPADLRYIPRFVITSVEPGTEYFPLMLSTVFAINMVSNFLSCPEWIRVYEAIGFEGPDISVMAPEEHVKVISTEDRLNFIATLMTKILVPVGHMVALDIPINPTVSFGIVPTGRDIDKQTVTQLEAVLGHLSHGRFASNNAPYVLMPAGVEIDIGTYEALYYNQPRDSRYVDALFIRHMQPGGDFSYWSAFEDSLFPEYDQQGMLSMSLTNNWRQRQKRKDLQEHFAGEITTHNVVSRYAVSRDGLCDIQRGFESSGVRVTVERFIKTRPAVKPDMY